MGHLKLKNMECLFSGLCIPHLQDVDQKDKGPNAVHHAAVVGEQGLPAAAHPDVELLSVVVVAVVGRVVRELLLDAGPW